VTVAPATIPTTAPRASTTFSARFFESTSTHQPPPALYSSPPDNPFAGGPAGRAEIYAVGFRNPFRFSFDRETGDLVVGDVGQNAREEIDVVTRGGNYGWRVFEGTLCTGLDPVLCAVGGFIPPVADYDHAGRCSITGGYVYRGTRDTLPAGTYVYGDFCSGEILQLFPVASNGTQMHLLDTALSIASFGEDEAGEILVVALEGSVFRLVASPLLPDGGDSEPPGTPPSGDGGSRAGGVFSCFIAIYDRISPPVAAVIRQRPTLQAVTRRLLRPMIWAARAVETSPGRLLALLTAGPAVAGLLCYFLRGLEANPVRWDYGAPSCLRARPPRTTRRRRV
jgi:Glucose / Sorbosone dehydrogenase